MLQVHLMSNGSFTEKNKTDPLPNVARCLMFEFCSSWSFADITNLATLQLSAEKHRLWSNLEMDLDVLKFILYIFLYIYII